MIEAKYILNKMENLFVEHNFREANVLVDHLANKAITLVDMIIMEVEFLDLYL